MLVPLLVLVTFIVLVVVNSLVKDIYPVTLTKEDWVLVNSYQNKPRSLASRVVLIIESVEEYNVFSITNLLRNLLRQETKVDSIILVVPNPELAGQLKSVDLIKATCIIQKTGGLTNVFKESGDDTTLLFVSNKAFDDFSNNQHIQRCLKEPKLRGIIKLVNKDLVVDINHV
jgi:hypothetical protein